MHKLPKEQRVARATKASLAALGSSAVAKKRVERVNKYGPAWDKVYSTMQGAKRRCTLTTDAGYKNYGGRGICFLFTSITEATQWVLDNLGAPFEGASIDRIDNDRHYEPGNLRWATRTEQARNKRAYKRGEAGERIRRIQQIRQDLTYETIRQWIKLGRTDDEIINRRKHLGCGSVRHKELRTEESVHG